MVRLISRRANLCATIISQWTRGEGRTGPLPSFLYPFPQTILLDSSLGFAGDQHPSQRGCSLRRKNNRNHHIHGSYQFLRLGQMDSEYPIHARRSARQYLGPTATVHKLQPAGSSPKRIDRRSSAVSIRNRHEGMPLVAIIEDKRRRSRPIPIRSYRCKR